MPRRSSLVLLIAILPLLTLGGCDQGGDEVPRTSITLLVAYTTASREAVGDIERHIRRSVQETNQVYREGRIPIELVPVHLVEVTYTMGDRMQDLRRLLDPDDGHLDGLHLLRNQYEADLIALVAENRTSTFNAAVMATPETAFVMVWWDGMGAPDYSLAHEIGHLQGARHAIQSDPLLEPFPYGHGFRNDSLRTIMAGGAGELVPRFSGPDQRFDGVVLGDSSVADVARLLRESAVYLSNFRGPLTPTDFVPPSTWPTIP